MSSRSQMLFAALLIFVGSQAVCQSSAQEGQGWSDFNAADQAEVAAIKDIFRVLNERYVKLANQAQRDEQSRNAELKLPLLATLKSDFEGKANVLFPNPNFGLTLVRPHTLIEIKLDYPDEPSPVAWALKATILHDILDLWKVEQRKVATKPAARDPVAEANRKISSGQVNSDSQGPPPSQRDLRNTHLAD